LWQHSYDAAKIHTEAVRAGHIVCMDRKRAWEV